MLYTKNSQEGVASVEFALIFMVLLSICFAIVSYGMLIWTQQKISHITGDIVRVVFQESLQGKENWNKYDICAEHAIPMIEADAILGLADVNCEYDFKNCVVQEVASISQSQCFWLTINVESDSLPLVSVMQRLGKFITNDTIAWVPENISAIHEILIAEIPKT